MNNTTTSLPTFVSVSQLQRGYAKILERLKSEGKPLIVLRKNKLEAVIIEPNYYEELIKNTQQLEEQKALIAIGDYKIEKRDSKLKRLNKTSELFD